MPEHITPPVQASVRIAFFDLDKTLLSRNSAVLWIGHEVRHGRIGHLDALRAFAWLVRYRLGSGKLEAPIRESIRMLKGTAEEALRIRTESFYETSVRSLFRPGARRAVHHHRQAGDRLVMLTSATRYLAAPSARELGLDAIVCTELAVDEQGLFTGEPLALCYGEGKLALARRYAESQGASLRDSTFYTDSASDLPVLEAVGRPVAVSPDPRLRRAARTRGWPIVSWGS